MRNFRIIDDYVTPRLLKKFSEALLARGMDIRWSTFVALVPGFNPAIIDAMERSGCSYVGFGLESMTDRILKLMNKPHTAHRAIEIIDMFKVSSISMNVNVIFGFPTETLEEASTTLDYLIRNQDAFNHILLYQFGLVEGTEIYDNPQKYGIKRVYEKSRSGDPRLGFGYDTDEGMSQRQSALFVARAKRTLRTL